MEQRLDAADLRLVQIVDAAMAEATRLGGDHLVCRAGCTECCTGPFPINYLDSRRLQRGIREIRKSDPARAGRVLQRARETALLFVPEFPGDPSTGLLSDDEGADEALAERFAAVPCPALDPERGVCDVYDYRPIPCRTYGPPVRIEANTVEPCRLCFTEASDSEVEAACVTLEPPACEELLHVEHGLAQTVIAFALAFAPDD